MERSLVLVTAIFGLVTYFLNSDNFQVNFCTIILNAVFHFSDVKTLKLCNTKSQLKHSLKMLVTLTHLICRTYHGMMQVATQVSCNLLGVAAKCLQTMLMPPLWPWFAQWSYSPFGGEGIADSQRPILLEHPVDSYFYLSTRVVLTISVVHHVLWCGALKLQDSLGFVHLHEVEEVNKTSFF